MTQTKIKTARSNLDISLILLYSFTTIALAFLIALSITLIGQRAQASGVECSKIVDQAERLQCLQKAEPNDLAVKKQPKETKPNDSILEDENLQNRHNPYDQNLTTPVPPSTPSAD